MRVWESVSVGVWECKMGVRVCGSVSVDVGVYMIHKSPISVQNIISRKPIQKSSISKEGEMEIAK